MPTKSGEKLLYEDLTFSTQKGFTLIEIMAVVSIMIILSGIVLVNYKSFGDQFALQRSANQLAQDVRRAQEMAMSAKECPAGITNCPAVGESFSYIYGIHADDGVSNNKYYILFTDIDKDYQFVSTNDALIEEIWLEKGIIIFNTDEANITFSSPDPTIELKKSGGLVAEITITLAIETDLSRIKTITVNKAGLIEIQ